MPSSDSVKVAVRVRPFNQREITAGSKCILSMTGQTTKITNPRNKETKTFSFDHSYWSHDDFTENEKDVMVPKSKSSKYADQQTVYSDLGGVVLDNAWQGYNAALFAYGQTGSGKSYSMIGYGSNKGIVPITCGELFKAIESNNDKKKQLQVSFSMLEIYNEQVKDLLSKVKKQEYGGLKIRQHPKSGFYVQGLKQVPVKSYDQVEKLMEQGTVSRTTASTNMNTTSSRSHMVITIKFNQIFENEFGESTTKSSEISLVDLAGSERADSTGATGDRLKEGSAINKSLSTLGDVISALAGGEKRGMVPYRNSALTKLLKSALGGNSRTIMIAALSPADINYDETLSTLRYADRAKKIQNNAEINESPTDRLIRELKEENARLMKQLSGSQVKTKSGDDEEELQKALEENERKMTDLQLSWEQRLEQARKEWQKSATTGQEDLWEKQPYITNVNEDPMLSGVIKFSFTEKNSIIGRAGSPGLHIELCGFGIQPKHAVVSKDSGGIFINPSSHDCLVMVNGEKVKHKTKLHHLDRLKFGSNNLFLFVGFPSERRKNDPQYDYTFVQTELAKSTGLAPDLDTATPGDTDMAAQLAAIFQDYISLLPQISEANAISQELKKNIHFSLEVKSYASHDPKDKSKELLVHVHNTDTKQVWIWSKMKFVNRKNLIDEMYLKFMDGDKISVDKLKDPFWDPVEDVFLGSCQVWLGVLTYHFDFDQHLSLQNYRGKEEAVVHVQVVPCMEDGRSIYVDDLVVNEPNDLLGKSLHFTVSIGRVIGIRWIQELNSRGIYLRAHVPGHSETLKTSTVWNQDMADVRYSKQINIRKVDANFLNVLKTDALVLEIWGVQAESDLRPRRLSASLHNVDINGIYQENSKLRDAEIEELLEENRTLRAENFKLKQSLEKRNQATALRGKRYSSNSSNLDDEDSRSLSRSARRAASRSNSQRSVSPVQSHRSPQRPGFDVELAKGLRDFFKEIKQVQQSLTTLKEDSASLQKSSDKSALKKGVVRFHDNIKTAEEDLSSNVTALKDSVTGAVHRSQKLQSNGT